MKKLLTILVVLLLAALYLPSSTNAEYLPVKLNGINAPHKLEEFRDNGMTSAECLDGDIYFRISKTISKIEIFIENKGGRNVALQVNLSKTYIKPRQVGRIVSEYNIPVEIYLQNDNTILKYKLKAFTKTEFQISKASIAGGRIKEGLGQLVGRHLIYSIPENGTSEMSVIVPKQVDGEKVDPGNVIVTKRTDFFGWFKPLTTEVDQESSNYVIRDFGDNYQVLVDFSNESTDIVRTYTFEDNWRGEIGYHIIKTKVEMTGAIIQWFG